MNHRETIASIDVNRKYLPKSYWLKNWNLASVKGVQALSPDSILFYGGIGVWLTDSTYSTWEPFMDGIPKGSDYQKVFDLHVTPKGILAATRFGLYYRTLGATNWQKIELPEHDQLCTAIEQVDSLLYISTRSNIYTSSCQSINLKPIDIKPPLGSKSEIGVFRLLWILHSGEIIGITGRLMADLVGLSMTFLSITGLIYFISPKIIKRLKNRFRFKKLKKTTKYSYKWHLKVGAMATVLLILSGLTGIFLRPPFLVAIANAKLEISHRVKSNANFWYDKLRDIRYDPFRKQFIIATSEGVYRCNDFSEPLFKFPKQPPISVMGVNVLEPLDNGLYLVGSFSGLFSWNPDTGQTINYLTGKPHHIDAGLRKPVGDFAISGFARIHKQEYIFDYDRGMLPIHHSEKVLPMPERVLHSFRLPLWNLAQEFHTGRIFSFLLGDFYILVVPLAGIALVLVVLTGFMMWYKRKYLN